MKLFTWQAEAREHLTDPEDREKAIAEAKVEQQKWDSGDYEGCNSEDLMHDYAYLRMEKELFEMGEKIIRDWPWENKEFIICDFVYQHYGIYYYLEKKLKEAEKWFLKVLSHDCEGYDAHVWDWLTCVYAEMGNHEKALEGINKMRDYQESLESNKYFHAYDFARYFYSIGMHEEAIIEFEKYETKKSLVDSEFYIYKAFCLRELGRFEEARLFLEEGNKKWHRDAELQVRLAMMIFEDLHDSDRTLELLLKSFETSKEYEGWEDWNSSILNNISKIYAEKGEWDKAFDYLRQSVITKAGNKNPEQLLALIDTRPVGDDVDQAQVYVTIDNFLQGSLFSLDEETDSQEENPYLVDTNDEETIHELTLPENFTSN